MRAESTYSKPSLIFRARVRPAATLLLVVLGLESESSASKRIGDHQYFITTPQAKNNQFKLALNKYGL
jgi:hypothetical protein